MTDQTTADRGLSRRRFLKGILAATAVVGVPIVSEDAPGDGKITEDNAATSLREVQCWARVLSPIAVMQNGHRVRYSPGDWVQLSKTELDGLEDGAVGLPLSPRYDD